MITNEVWTQHFGRDPNIVAKNVVFSDIAITIIAVLAPAFHFSTADRWNHPGFGAVVRLKPRVSLERAHSEIAAIARSLVHDYPATNKDVSVRFTSRFDAVAVYVRLMPARRTLRIDSDGRVARGVRILETRQKQTG